MSDVYLAAIFTIIGGVVVFVLSEMIKEIWLSPLQKYKSLKHDISYKLAYYARYYTEVMDPADNSGNLYKKYNEAADDLHSLACELKGFIETLSWFKPLIPSRIALSKASEQIMGLSNGFFCGYNANTSSEHSEHNETRARKIKCLLKLTD